MKCEICGAKNVNQHTKLQEVVHALMVLVVDVELYYKYTNDPDKELEIAINQANAVLKSYREKIFY